MPISKYALKKRALFLEQEIIGLGYDTKETLEAWFERHCDDNHPPMDRLSFLAFRVAWLDSIRSRRYKSASKNDVYTRAHDSV